MFFFFFLFTGSVGISRAKGFETVRFWDELVRQDATNIIIQKMDGYKCALGCGFDGVDITIWG
jgi:hypothetical protein